MAEKLTREDVEAQKRVPAFQVVNDEGVTDLKACRADVFDALCDLALKGLGAGERLEKLEQALRNAVVRIERHAPYTDDYAWNIHAELWALFNPDPTAFRAALSAQPSACPHGCVDGLVTTYKDSPIGDIKTPCPIHSAKQKETDR